MCKEILAISCTEDLTLKLNMNMLILVHCLQSQLHKLNYWSINAEHYQEKLGKRSHAINRMFRHFSSQYNTIYITSLFQSIITIIFKYVKVIRYSFAYVGTNNITHKVGTFSFFEIGICKENVKILQLEMKGRF